MPREIKVVLFDLGGVLVELTGVPVMLDWAQETMTPEQLGVKWLSSPTVRAFETGRMSSDEFAEKLVVEMAFSVSTDEFIAAFTYWPKGLYPGVIELLQRIPPKYMLATLSNTNALHWSRAMSEMKLLDYFQYHFPSHLLGVLKPDPEVFEHVIDHLSCEPASVLFIDDNLLNVNAARAIGICAQEAKGVTGAEQVLIEYGVISELVKGPLCQRKVSYSL